MSRVAPNNIKTLIITFGILLFGVGTVAIVDSADSYSKVTTVVNSQQQITQISYRGADGADALSLLKKHATVTTKHYSFGDLVTSINGSAGNGPKYWTFYINDKESSVGAGAYITKNSDTLLWKLQ